jgi:hypothetical protein
VHYWNGRNVGYKFKNNLKAGRDKPVKLKTRKEIKIESH